MTKYNKIGIYVHIPFCIKKCPYCDFYSVAYNAKSNLERQYIEAVIEEIKTYKTVAKKNKLLVDTIYFGGGTPSLIDGQNVGKIVKMLKNSFRYKNLEVTLEANPNIIIDKKYLRHLKRVGVNRLSFGMQSANDNELYILGRSHNASDVENIVKMARDVGFKNISVDLMIGLPYQTLKKVELSLKFIEKLDVEHVSAYILQIEKNTVFGANKIEDKLPKEEKVAEIYLNVVERLKEMGFLQYEISNFAKIGFESKHNLKYWNMQEYIGFGVAAHSFVLGKRYYIDRNIYKYIGMGQNKKFDYCDESDENTINEYIMLKLRTSDGICLDEINKRYPQELVDEFLIKVKKYNDQRYIKLDDKNLRLTPRGFLIYNTIISNIMVD